MGTSSSGGGSGSGGASGEASGGGGEGGGSGGSGSSGSTSGGSECGGAASLSFLSPGAMAENPIWLAVAAEGAVTRVAYSAEGTLPLGESTDAANDFGVEATLEVLGPRTLVATGYDACGAALATAMLVTVVGEGEGESESGDSGGGMPGEVCYPGASLAWDVCWPLVAPTLPDGYVYPPPLDNDPNFRVPVAYLELAGLDPGTALAPNFQLKEVARPEFGAFAVVQPAAIVHLQNMRDDLGGLAIAAGYRSPGANASVGGSTWSRHIYGDAFDIKPSSASLQALYDRCGAEGAGFRQLYEDHVHCDWRNEAVDEGFFGPPAGMVAPAPGPLAAAIVADGDAWAAPASGWDEGEPLREWTAWNGEGGVIGTAIGRRFAAPAGAVRIGVRVGGVLERELAVP